MKLGFKRTGLNVLLIDHLGNLTPINNVVYKDETAVLKAFEKQEITVPASFAGFTILPVLSVAEVKEEKPKAEKPAPKGNAKVVPTGEAKKEGE